MASPSDNLTPTPVVTVFGSSRVGPAHTEYDEALKLGRLIGERRWVLCNGGYNGTMEAAARGAKEAGGATIGVTVPSFLETKPNLWIDQMIVAPSLFARLERLLTLAHAYVVLHGGIGTLLELAMVWNAVQSVDQKKPVLVVGPDWQAALDTLRRRLPMHPWEIESLTLVPSVDAAITHLDHFFATSNPSGNPAPGHS